MLLQIGPIGGLGQVRRRLQSAVGGGTGGSVETRRGVPDASAGEGVSPDTIRAEDWDNTFGSNLQAGVYRDAAEFVIGAQNAYNIGFGKAEFPDVVGRWYQILDDGNGNQVVGLSRLKTRNSNDERVDTEVRAVEAATLNANANDYRTQFALPENRETPKVGEDSKIVFQFKLSPSSTGTSIDFGDSTQKIPLSNYS